MILLTPCLKWCPCCLSILNSLSTPELLCQLQSSSFQLCRRHAGIHDLLHCSLRDALCLLVQFPDILQLGSRRCLPQQLLHLQGRASLSIQACCSAYGGCPAQHNAGSRQSHQRTSSNEGGQSCPPMAAAALRTAVADSRHGQQVRALMRCATCPTALQPVA